MGRYVGDDGDDHRRPDNNPITHSVNSVTTARGTTRNAQLRPGLRSAQIRLPTASAARSRTQNFGRNNHRHTVGRRRAARLRRPRLPAGTSPRKCSTQFGQGMSMTGGYYRNCPGMGTSMRSTDNLEVTPAGLRPVLHHGADRSAAAWRRRVSGLRSVRRRRRRSSGASNNVVTQASHFGEQTRVVGLFSASTSTRGWARGCSWAAAWTRGER